MKRGPARRATFMIPFRARNGSTIWRKALARERSPVSCGMLSFTWLSWSTGRPRPGREHRPRR